MRIGTPARGMVVAEESTYLRAKMTEIHGAIERLTDMLNKMVEVLSRMSKTPEMIEDLSLTIAANSERVEEVIKLVKALSAGAAAGEVRGVVDKGAVSSITAVFETLDTQIREGVIASDLARKLNESADMIAQKGGTATVVVKMQRWVRILRTYGRVDPISSADLTKLRSDLKEWQKDISRMHS
jgi:CHASE3 domain sensor protein